VNCATERQNLIDRLAQWSGGMLRSAHAMIAPPPYSRGTEACLGMVSGNQEGTPSTAAELAFIAWPEVEELVSPTRPLAVSGAGTASCCSASHEGCVCYGQKHR